MGLWELKIYDRPERRGKRKRGIRENCLVGAYISSGIFLWVFVFCTSGVVGVSGFVASPLVQFFELKVSSLR